MAASPPATAIASLGRALRGPLIGRADARFDDARRIWNGRIDRRPLLIARCADVSDIIACVRFAQDHALPVAVRGSGHACAGTALCDDGLVVDMSRMKGIRVVPDGGIVRAEPGVTWGDMDHATQAFGFAVPGGPALASPAVFSARWCRFTAWPTGLAGIRGKQLLSAEELLLVDRAQLLTLTAPEMTAPVGGLRVRRRTDGISSKVKFAP
jgi:FAD/FMN-containing dehydrogenase